MDRVKWRRPALVADVVVVGGGIAGLLAALEAAKYSRRVLLVDKLQPGIAGSSATAGCGSAAVVGGVYRGSGTGRTGDTIAFHRDDTMAGGEYLSDPDIVATWTQEIVPLVKELEELGVRWAKTAAGQYIQLQPMGHSYPRVLEPIGGSPHVLGVLRRELHIRGVQTLCNTAVLKLIRRGGRVAGLIGYDTDSGEFVAIAAGAVVLAGGSCLGMVKFTSANYRTTGDAYRLALDAGATLANMEFMEFTVIPKIGRYVLPAGGISPFVGRGAIIVNAAGERFLQRHDPERMERTTRAQLARAIYLEWEEGRGPVYNDATHFPEEVWIEFEKTQAILVKLRSLNVDYRRQRFEWVPAVHTFLGGAVVDRDGQTTVPGLFAAGESATGVHGANRVASNAVPAYMVLGKRAGRQAAKDARLLGEGRGGWGSERSGSPPRPAGFTKLARVALEEVLAEFRAVGESPAAVEQELREATWSGIGVVRDRVGLNRLLQRLTELQSLPLGTQDGLVRAFEVANEIRVAGLTARAALARAESRGQHYRRDFPACADELTGWFAFRPGEQQPTFMPVPGTGVALSSPRAPR